MFLTEPDPGHPNRLLRTQYPDAPFERLLTWLLAIPLWQRPATVLGQRLAEFKRELADLRATGNATQVADYQAGTLPPTETPAVTPSIAPTDRMAKARAAAQRKREAQKLSASA